MSRPATQDNSTAVSLFPFLAVLLCTMGALIVLLVAMAHAASQRAAMLESVEPEPEAVPVAAAAPPPAMPDPELEERLRTANEREQELAKINAKAAESLRDDETRLSHIEDHIRRLREQLVALKQAERELAALDDSYQDNRDSAEEETERLRQLIAEVEADIERFDEEQQGKQKSYAIVPYKGPNGTRRKPVYIECRGNEVVLQPGGVTLGPIDFRPPLGVGNPLSAALRATRKHHDQANPRQAYDPDSAPYPLILVRPSGIDLYHRVRAALESADSEFGYEMVDEDWDLRFGLPDPVLASRQAEAIDHARLRRRLLSRAAPSAYEDAGGSSYALSRRRSGRGAGGRGDGDEYGDGGGTGGGYGSADNAIAGTPYSPEDTLRYGATETNQPSRLSGSAYSQPGDAGPPGAAGASADGPEGANPYGAFAEGSSAAEEPVNETESSRYASASDSQGTQATTASNAAGEAGGGAPSSGEQASARASRQAGGAPGGLPGLPGQSQTAAAEFGSQPGNGGAGGAGGERRRRDDLPIRRPISLVVHGDRVAITPVDDDGRALRTGAEVLPFAGRTDQMLPGVMSAIERQVRSWGIAGRGFYWKPVLVLSVAPSGDRRADELVSLLGRRGVEVRYHNTANRPNQEAAGAQR